MAGTQGSYWLAQLAECERLLAAAPTRGAWLRRAYARIYRFLIAQYGDSPPSAPPSTMPFVDATQSLEGKAARSPGEIQTALKHIQAAQPESAAVAARPLPLDETWITVAQRHDRFDLTACEYLLHSHGIPTRRLRQGMHLLLQTPGAYREQAFALIAGQRDQLRVAPEVFRQRRRATAVRLSLLAFSIALASGCLTLGTAIGGSVGAWLFATGLISLVVLCIAVLCGRLSREAHSHARPRP